MRPLKAIALKNRLLITAGRTGLFVLVATITIVPTCLLFIGYIDFYYRFVVLTICGTLGLLVTWWWGARPEDIGFTRKSIERSISLGLLVFIVVYCGLHIIGVANTKPLPSNKIFYVFYILISCPLQEVFFRGCVYYSLTENGKSNIIYIIVSAMLYASVHIIYRDYVVVIGALLLGVGWAIIFARTRNIVGIIISHILVGVYTIQIGAI
jgi:membrane protease YdiL (CAAX protease family)